MIANADAAPTARKIAVFFHYFEANATYRDNLVFFLALAYRPELDFFVVISGDCSVALPALDNVRYLYTGNLNNDFGGYVFALGAIAGLDEYDAFVFVNSSVRGPFLAPAERSWTERFVDALHADVHLVGSSINVLPESSPFTAKFAALFDYPKPYSHVQTTAYALSRDALRHLRRIGFYDVHDALPKDEVICRYELRLSQEIKRAGWNLGCLLARYKGVDYRLPHTDPNPTSNQGDPLFRGAYFGANAKPEELVFVKTNRDLFGGPRMHWDTLRALARVDQPALRAWPESRSLRGRSRRLFARSIAGRIKARLFGT
jgi:hypothetical protein